VRELTVRKAVEADRDILADLEFISREAAFMEMYGTVDDLPSIEELRSRWTQKLSQSQGLVVVCESDGIITGYFYLCKYLGKPSFVLNGLYVRPDCWGHGIGKKLIIFMEKVVRKIASDAGLTAEKSDPDGFKPVILLDVIRENTRAIDFYRSFGYDFTGREEPFELGCRTIILREMKKILD
jgi:GNAT superfamily N-acetyltransferase